MKSPDGKISIDERIYREIEQIVSHSELFDSVEDYVNAVLRELLAGADNSVPKDDPQLRERLRDLGYL